ncbi:MAG: acyl-CoA dehydrogenase family protein [Gemmatimonadota bacterium]
MTNRSERGASFLLGPTDPADVVTPDDLGEEERMLVRSLVEFAEREIGPAMDKLVARDPETSRGLFKKAAELGIFMAEVPEEMGGLDLSVLAITAMCSPPADIGPMGQMLWGHQGIGMLPIVNFGTPEQIERYLGPCMEGDMLSAFALTEPGTGSDAMNIQARAELDDAGTHYVLNGSKQWITNAGWADLFVLFAKVGGEQFTAFLVERESPGLSVHEPEHLLGHDGSSVNALSLEDVRVPVENVLGEVGRGHKVAFCTLNMGRLKLAAGSATGAKIALGVAARYAAERVQFGVPIATFGLIKRKLADMAARAYAADSLSYRTAGLVYHKLESLDDGTPVSPERRLQALAEFSVECALAKVYSSEAYNTNADEAVQVFGGYGFSEEYPPAKMYRDSRISRIYEGTNEISRLYAQRTIFKKLAKGFGGGLAQGVKALADPHGLQRAAEGGGAGDGGADEERLAALKRLYFMLMGEALARLGPEGLNEPARQQFLASLADIAMEIFAAESVVLRVAKLGGEGSQEEGAIRRALATLVFHRSLERTRSEARTVLSELHRGEDLSRRLREMEESLPTPEGMVDVRNRVADWVVGKSGALPGGIA